ncbi:MAG: hypothetical protein JKY56_14470 [Kofleriaceae bacterium]|nr:hypothetical protein [Kofleriaceae bacterium]
MSKSQFTISYGYIQDESTVRVIATIDILTDAGSTMSGLHKYIVPAKEKTVFDLDWSAVAISTRPQPDFCGVAISESGKTLVSKATGNTFLRIDSVR